MLKEFVSKVKHGANVVVTSAAGLMLNLQAMKCEGWEDLESTEGFSTLFTNIGNVYMKWAWFFGGIALVVYLISRGNEKRAAAAKATLIGIIAGYVVFGLGGAVISGVFQSIGEAF